MSPQKATNPSAANHKYAATSTEKAAKLFGFGHYTIVVGQLPPDEAGEDWANCIWSLEEEWIVIRFGDLSAFTKKQIDHLVIHELTHVLIGMAVSAPLLEEVVCNRVATAMTSPDAGARGITLQGPIGKDLSGLTGDAQFKHSDKQRLNDIERKLIEASLPQVLLRLPRAPRELLCRIYVDGASLSEIAAEEGVHRSSIMRRRDNALRILQSYYIANGGQTDGA